MGQEDGRVGGPVAVVAAVQRPDGTVDGRLYVRDASGPEVELHAACLVDGAVAEQPGVGLQQAALRLEQGLHVRRACLLLALEEELDVHRGSDAARLQGVERREQADDWRLVVACGARIEPPLRVEGRLPRRPGDLAASLLQRPIAQHGNPGVAGPLGPVHRLAVVVGVDDDRPCGARGLELAVHSGRASLDPEEAGPHPAALEQGDDGVRVPADTRGVAGQVRDGRQVRELAHDVDLVGLPVLAHLIPQADLRPCPQGQRSARNDGEPARHLGRCLRPLYLKAPPHLRGARLGARGASPRPCAASPGIPRRGPSRPRSRRPCGT